MFRSFVAPLLFPALVAVLAVGCASSNGGSDASATTPAATAPESTVTSTTRPPVSTTTTTTVEAQSLPPVPPTTEREPFAVDWAVPSGGLELDPFDVVAVRADGELVLYRDVRGNDPSSSVLLDADDTDEASLVVDDVGGVIGGALVLGAADDAAFRAWSLAGEGDRPEAFTAGIAPSFSRDRNWLVTVDPAQGEMLVHDVPSALVTSPSLGLAAGERPVDVVWAPDRASVFVLVADDAGASSLVQVEMRSPFAVLTTYDLDRLFGEDAVTAGLAGLGPSGEIGLSATVGDQVVVRFLDPLTLEERPERERTLSAAATSVRIGPDGGGLLWVEDTALWFLPLFEDARPLDLEVEAAWFVG